MAEAVAKVPLVGIFVGGASSRMGATKGLLKAPDGTGRTLVERLVSETRRALSDVRVVLVGRHPAYEFLGMESLLDAKVGVGPLGGIVALLKAARLSGQQGGLVLACDLPYLEAPLISRLAMCEPDAALLCPREDGLFQPLFARYDVSLLADFEKALSEDKRALQPLLSEHGARALPLSPEEAASLRDWDSPEDVH